MNIQPFFLMLVLLAAQYIFGRYPSFALILARPIGLVALTIGVVGGALMLLGAFSLAWRKTTLHPGHRPQKLVTGGVYRYSRNPIYLGMLLILCTIPLMATQPRLLIFTLIYYVIMDFYVIPREEKIVQSAMGTVYQVYLSRTRRWFGTYY